MVLSAIYNNNFLNSLFTSSEFKFINHIDSDMEKIDSMLTREETNRDIIVTFINNLKDEISSSDFNGDSENFSELLADAQNIFELINENINYLQISKETSNEINQSIVDLLIKIESEDSSIAKDKFAQEIIEFKDRINEFATKSEQSKSKLILNDLKIDNFLKQYVSQEYTSILVDTKETSSKKSTKNSFSELEKLIPENMKQNNQTLLVSENLKKVYLPYSKGEVLKYLEQYPNQYESFEDVVEQEFIFPLDFYVKHPVIARFRETYSLIRDRESKSVLEALKYAMDLMFNYNLNPAIIAACKTQDQLENYLFCLEKNKLDKFTDFEIRFELTPFKK